MYLVIFNFHTAIQPCNYSVFQIVHFLICINVLCFITYGVNEIITYSLQVTVSLLRLSPYYSSHSGIHKQCLINQKPSLPPGAFAAKPPFRLLYFPIGGLDPNLITMDLFSMWHLLQLIFLIFDIIICLNR